MRFVKNQARFLSVALSYLEYTKYSRKSFIDKIYQNLLKVLELLNKPYLFTVFESFIMYDVRIQGLIQEARRPRQFRILNKTDPPKTDFI